MIPNGLPPLDLPFHDQEPNACRNCKHSYFKAKETASRDLRCSKVTPNQRCLYARHETGECGPAAKYWKDRRNV